jgi:hypothetical protein
MRRFIQSLLRRSEFPNTQKNYQSEFDRFLQHYNAERATENPSRQEERDKYATLATRRDTP